MSTQELTNEQKLVNEITLLKARMFDIQENAQSQISQYTEMLSKVVQALEIETDDGQITLETVLSRIEELKK